MLDCWKSIQYALNTYDISGASIDYPVWNEIVSKDFDEFGEKAKTDEWNYYVFSELLLISQKVKLNKKVPMNEFDSEDFEEEQDVIPKETILKIINSTLFGIAKKLFHSRFYKSISIFLVRKNKYYLYNTYISGKWNVLKLSKLLGDWPVLTVDHPETDLSRVKYSERNYLKFGDGICENFEDTAKFFLPKLMPLIYLEGFNDLLRCTE